MKHIPNIITLANLLCGCLSIVAAFSGELILAGFLIFLAAIFDFLDGFLAKLLNAHSELGKQLDSLADIVSFGVAPAMIAWVIIWEASVMLGGFEGFPFSQFSYVAFVMVLFSALRLAKFNAETTESEHFTGMPTPANGMFWASLPFVLYALCENELLGLEAFLFHPITIATLCVIFATLLVLPIPMMSLKFKKFDFKSNWQRFVLIGIVLGLFIFIGFSAIAVGILIYPLFSFFLAKNKKVA